MTSITHSFWRCQSGILLSLNLPQQRSLCGEDRAVPPVHSKDVFERTLVRVTCVFPNGEGALTVQGAEIAPNYLLCLEMVTYLSKVPSVGNTGLSLRSTVKMCLSELLSEWPACSRTEKAHCRFKERRSRQTASHCKLCTIIGAEEKEMSNSTPRFNSL